MRYLLSSTATVLCTMSATVNYIEKDWVWFWLLAALAVSNLSIALKNAANK